MNKAGQKSPELSENLWRRISRRYGVEESSMFLRQGAFGSDGKSGERREPEFKPKVRRKPPPRDD